MRRSEPSYAHSFHVTAASKRHAAHPTEAGYRTAAAQEEKLPDVAGSRGSDHLAFEGRVNNWREFDAIDVLARLSACHKARSERYPLRTAFDIMWCVPAVVADLGRP